MAMKNHRMRVAALGAVLGVLLATRPEAGVAEEKTKGPCCFTNPRYSGVCQVEPSAEETCSSILAYLNNPSSTGKSYCSSTDVRGGWAQAKCKQ